MRAVAKKAWIACVAALALVGGIVATYGIVRAAVPAHRITTHDWIVFERGADGQLVRGCFTPGCTEGNGLHCWTAWGRPNEYPEMEGAWYAPTGPIILPTTASRVRVLDGRWEETAAMLGLDLQECQ